MKVPSAQLGFRVACDELFGVVHMFNDIHNSLCNNSIFQENYSCSPGNPMTSL